MMLDATIMPKKK